VIPNKYAEGCPLDIKIKFFYCCIWIIPFWYPRVSQQEISLKFILLLCQVKPSGYGIPKITSLRPWGQLILAMPPPLGLAKPYTLIMYMV
jgi:hypothetical protein